MSKKTISRYCPFKDTERQNLTLCVYTNPKEFNTNEIKKFQLHYFHFDHRCQRHQWSTFGLEYLRECSLKNQKGFNHIIRAEGEDNWWKKTRSQKSRVRVPLRYGANSAATRRKLEFHPLLLLVLLRHINTLSSDTGPGLHIAVWSSKNSILILPALRFIFDVFFSISHRFIRMPNALYNLVAYYHADTNILSYSVHSLNTIPSTLKGQFK